MYRYFVLILYFNRDFHSPTELKSYKITLYIDYDKLHKNFNSTEIKFCGLLLFQTPFECGTPEYVPNSQVTFVETNGVAQYSCDPGYQLVGDSEIRCSKNGRWQEEFPHCVLHSLCPIDVINSTSTLNVTFYNTMTDSNGMTIAILGSIVRYSCNNQSSINGKNILIGPRSAICMKNGKWSGTIPHCISMFLVIKNYFYSRN